jgi:hypothetical protein
MSNTNATALSARETVLFVHGTFAADDRESGAAWWQRDSQFQITLQQHLGARVKCSPRGATFLYPRPWWRRLLAFVRHRASPPDSLESVFHWSGNNSETARRQAGALLLEHLKVFNDRGPFHVIAHSHGGSVLWESLCLAARESPSQPEGELLPNLKSWTTVGTPFMHFRPKYGYLVHALLVILLVILGYFELPWLADYYQHVCPTVSASWQSKAATVVLSVGLAIFAVALLLKALFSLYYYFDVVKVSPQAVQELRIHQRDDIVSSILGLSFVILVAFLSQSYIISTQTLAALTWADSLPIACSLGYLALFACLGMTYFWWAVAPLYHGWKNRKRHTARMRAWDAFGDRCLCFADPQLDEAILGLRAIRAPVRATILPRMPSPREGIFSVHKRHLRRPEAEHAKAAFWSWCVAYLLLPLVVIRDWVVAPFYNEVFARLIEDYVILRTHDRAIGNDIPGLVLGHISVHPMAVAPDQDQYLATCPQNAHDELESQINAGAAALMHSIRHQLGLDYPVGLELATVFQNAMKNMGSAAPLLAHTSYFNCKEVQNVLVAHISRQPVHGFVKPRAGDSPEEEFKPSGRLHFVWWIVRSMVWLFLWTLPILLLGLFGYVCLYPYSEEYHVRWAQDRVPMTVLANSSQFREPSQGSLATPLTVRWWVACRMLESSNHDDFGQEIEAPRDRVYFYSKVGQKLAELGEEQEALSAFKSANGVIGALPGNEQAACDRILARSIAVASYFMSGDSIELLRDTVSGSDPIHFAQLVQAETKKLRDYLWSDAFVDFRTWEQSAPKVEEVLKWVRRSGPDGQAPDVLQAKRLAFILCFAPESVRSQKVLANSLEGLLSAIIERAQNLDASARKAQMDALRYSACWALAASLRVTHDSRDELITQARSLRDLVGECPDEDGDVVLSWLEITILLSQVEAHRLEVSYKTLSEAERRIAELKPTVDRKPFFQKLCAGYAAIGFDRHARLLTSGRGGRVRAATSLAILIRKVGVTRPQQDRIHQLLILSDGWFPDR